MTHPDWRHWNTFDFPSILHNQHRQTVQFQWSILSICMSICSQYKFKWKTSFWWHCSFPSYFCHYLPPYIYMNCSNLSFVTLQTGQVSGGLSLAQRYPQTLHRQTGYCNSDFISEDWAKGFWDFLSSSVCLRSGIDSASFWLSAISLDTYKAQ